MTQVFSDTQTFAIHAVLSVGLSVLFDIVFLNHWLNSVPTHTILDFVMGVLVRIPVALVMVFVAMHIVSLSMYLLDKIAQLMVAKAGGTNDSE